MRGRTSAAALRRVQVGNALSSFGAGFTIPYMFVYVAQVRGLGSMTAWLVFTVYALAALVVLPFTGPGLDRYGPRPVLTAGALLAAVGALVFGHAATGGTVVAGAFLFGAGTTVVQPALATMVVRCTGPARRAHAFAVQFTVANLGLGVGALIGGQIVDVSRPSSLTLLFTIEALMFLALAAVTGTVRDPALSAGTAFAGTASADAGAAERGRSDLRTLLRDRAMVRLCALAALIFFACYGQFESGVSAYATGTVGISPSTLGLGLGANTLAIVLLQMVVVRFTARRRRTTAIVATGTVWLAAWAAAALAGLLHGSTAIAVGGMMTTYVLFGVGEALLAPTLGPMVADLAPAHLLGSYNAAFALVKQTAIALGPAAGVLLVGAGLSPLYLLAMGATTVLLVVLALRLRPALSPLQDNAPGAVRPSLGVAGTVRPQPAAELHAA
ncbi:MFS transporter [Streptomyces sp. NPDC092296]|uniref:MFS transporter n=1 Tax=Streptomyces sp. NPDC092296 TaxID=3366012 RepID=UPI0037F5BE5B